MVQKLTQREIKTLAKLIQFKLKTESPYIISKCTKEIKDKIIGMFIEDSFTDIASKQYPINLDNASLNTFIAKINKSRDFSNISDVYGCLPELGENYTQTPIVEDDAENDIPNNTSITSV